MRKRTLHKISTESSTTVTSLSPIITTNSKKKKLSSSKSISKTKVDKVVDIEDKNNNEDITLIMIITFIIKSNARSTWSMNKENYSL
ncbi:hypothetical protein Glove_19g80 [Diversispora epigaea]|uniref:Uncharacterized protein n=1 Tax=Diversispora epigaea TaxID=1348612 RepID=A0A397JMD9_9GLOM|nr:hypothetical protein Glove_19g80 [Diversispora epigaea]